MELGQKGVKDLERQKAVQEAAREAAALRRPVDSREALINDLISEVRLVLP